MFNYILNLFKSSRKEPVKEKPENFGLEPHQREYWQHPTKPLTTRPAQTPTSQPPVLKSQCSPATGRTSSSQVNHSNVSKTITEGSYKYGPDDDPLKPQPQSGPDLLTTYLIVSALTGDSNETKHEPVCTNDYGGSSSYDSCSFNSNDSFSSND